jgi:hypothetical protein
MIRRFQFSLGRLFASTTFAAVACGAFLTAAHLATAKGELAWILGLFFVACASCGAAIGCLLRLGVAGALAGLWASVAFYGIASQLL